MPGRDSSGLQAKPSSPAAPPSQSPATQSMASSPGSPGAIQRSATNQAGSVAGPDLHEIQTRRVDDPQLTSELQRAHVRYSAAAQNTWLWTMLSWLLPAILIVVAWNLMLGKAWALARA